MSEILKNELDEVHEAPIGPGKRLREARKAMRLDQSDVSAQLNLELRVIDAIERNDFSGLPPATFVRGYLRSYARLVALDPDQVIEQYHQVADGQPPELQARSGIRRQAAPGDGLVRTVSWLLAIGLVLSLGLWWFNEGRETEQAPAQTAGVVMEPGQALVEESVAVAEQAPPSPAAPTVVEEAPATGGEAAPAPVESPQQPAVVEQTPATAPAAQEEAVETAVVEETGKPAGQAGETAEPTAGGSTAEEAPTGEQGTSQAGPQPAADPDTLVITYSEDSWTSVEDATGRKLIYDLVKGDTVRELKGQAPFRVVLGNARAVRIEINGQSFDHMAYSRGNIARFQVARPEAAE